MKAREVDLQRVSEMDGVTDDIMQSFKNQDWDKVPVKDKAIALGIIQDKREKILVANDPTRPGGKKRPRRATFVFDFKNQQAEVTVEEDGGEE